MTSVCLVISDPILTHPGLDNKFMLRSLNSANEE